MKKIALMFAFLLIFAGSYAEKQHSIHYVTSVSGNPLSVCQPGDFIVNTATHMIYIVDSLVGTQTTLAADLTAGKVTAVSGLTANPHALASSIWPSVNNTYDLGSTAYKWKDFYLAGNATIAGTLNTTGITTAGTLNATVLSAATTLTLPGGLTFTKASGDANAVQLSHSLVVGTTSDTVTSAYSIFTNMSATTAGITTANIATNNTTTLNVSGTSSMKNIIKECTTPKPFDSTGTLAAADMLRGVIKCTSTSAVVMTTPTATAIAALIAGAGQGTQYDLVIDNTASTVSGTVTVTLDGSITVGTGVVTGGNTLTFAVGTAGKLSFYLKSGTAQYCYRAF